MYAESEIRTLLETRTRLLHDKDADAVTALYEPGALLFDLAPPLALTVDAAQTPHGLRSWFATWAGPVVYTAGDFVIQPHGGDFALAYGYVHMTGPRTDGTTTDSWFRQTLGLHKTSAGWRIVHEHTSVPFLMDGSERAALELKPEKLR